MSLIIVNEPMAIEAIGVEKRFGERTLWSNLSFAVSPGEMTAITGPSGSGKSTLLNCIGLLDSVSEGAIQLGRRDLVSMKKGARRRIYRNSLGFLFQNYGLVESWTVDQNLDVALGYSRQSRKEKSEAKDAALSRLGLRGRQSTRVSMLSGGEQQRVALARLILKSPAVILADEPTGSLDIGNAGVVVDILREFCAAGATVLVSTHDLRVVDQCDSSINLAPIDKPVAVA
ncbi:ATP-binding cassette domain-containing protein [Paenarthrobacter sp. NPDC091669]|uniref:ATP-binding cassette domain-containing protein n=1 Tax=Paenarthrobacter sp. NPDC091669 TaxID=3364384 RepID=UPI00380061C3